MATVSTSNHKQIGKFVDKLIVPAREVDYINMSVNNSSQKPCNSI